MIEIALWLIAFPLLLVLELVAIALGALMLALKGLENLLTK